MGGWITLFGDMDNSDLRIQKFKRIFDVKGVPNLIVEDQSHTRCFKSILWAWRTNGIPDVYVHSDKHNNVLILCGAVTDLGRFGSVNPDQNEIAKNVLELWKEHGDEIINQFNGSWSFLLSNCRENSATIFTDRFASRSIWISHDGNTWIMGNFPSAVVTMRQNVTTIDPAGLWSLFQTSRHIPGRGLYKEVFALKAGEKAILKSDGSYSISIWWRRKYNPDYNVFPKEWGHQLANALKDSAKRIKRITPNSYLFLSGGIDSRIAAASFEDGLKSITLCSSPNFESRIAELVSTHLGLEHQTMIRSPYWYLDTLEAATLISAGNYFTSHTHFIVPAVNIVTKYPDAAFLLGDLLENLNTHYFSIPSNGSLFFSPERLPCLLTDYVPFTSKDPKRLLQIFNKNVRERFRKCWKEAVQNSAKSVMDVSEDDCDIFDTFLRWIDVSVTYTYNMISCIWPFASERTLYLDNDVNNISLRIPSKIRGKSIIHSWILWHLNKRLLLIPNANNYLPILSPKWMQNMFKRFRPKFGHIRRKLYLKYKRNSLMLPTSGSWILMHQLYRRDRKYRSMIETLLQNKDVFPHDIFDYNGIKQLWNEFLDGNLNLLFEINSLITFGKLSCLIPCQGFSL